MNSRHVHLRLVARSTLLAILAALAVTSAAAAGDFRGDDTTTIGEGETVDDDLYVGAGTVSIAGTVNGDATIGAGTVTITGSIDGSLNVAGGTIDVLGDVSGAVRVTGGTVRIAGSVGRDVVVFGGTTSIERDAQIGGDVAGAGGALTVWGTVAGDLLAAAGTIQVEGTIDGSIDVTVDERLVIGPDAVVGGDVAYTSEREAQIDQGAQISGSVERRDPPADTTGTMITDNPVVSYLGVLIGMLLLGYGLLAIRPRLVIGSGDVLRTAPLPALGIGALAWIGQFVLIVILFIAGIILAALAGAVGGAFVIAALVVILLILLAILLATVPVAMAIGRLVMPGDRSVYLAYLAGAAILSLVLVAGGYVPVLGGVLFLCVWIVGLGAFVLYLWRTRREPLVLAPPPPAAVAASPPA